jgi:nucleoside-diphosphate-sugar epimerase
MDILITGIHGFVGSNLTASLKKHHTLFGIDIVSPSKDGVQKTYSWKEIGKVPPVDAIIHLAGIAHDIKNTTHSNEYFDVNVGLTKTIFDHFLKSGTKKFIYFSSVKAVADTVNSKILTEEEIPNPKTPYGQSKLEAENYILDQKISKDKRVYILRPAMIHGPGNKGNLNLLYQLIYKGYPYPLGSFNNQRSFTSIGNLNYIIEQLIENNILSGIYQIADNEPVSTNEIISLMADVLGRKPKIWNFPVGLIKTTARIGDFLSLPFNSERLKKLTENYVVSNQKITNTLGISLPISAIDGLITTLTSFQSNYSERIMRSNENYVPTDQQVIPTFEVSVPISAKHAS